MKKIDYLIIGGGISGTSAAEEIRSRDSQSSVAILTNESHHLYSRVQLPHYLRNEISLEAVYVRKIESYQQKNIQLFTDTQVSKINPSNKVVVSSTGQEFAYNKLLIASGGRVNKLSISGSDLPQIVYLRTLEDAKKIKELMPKSKKGLVVGGGFISAELAQSFTMNNIETTVVVREKSFWEAVLGENLAALLSQIMVRNGVTIINQAQISEFVGEHNLEKAKLDNGKEIEADIAGVGIGIHLEIDYLRNCGLGLNKGVVTNEFLETSIPDIWAAGDIAEFYDPVFKRHHSLGNWANASAQGRTVGLNMVGVKTAFQTTSMYSLKIFDSNLSFLGDPSLDENTEIIERGSAVENKIARIFLRDDIVSGVALINMPIERNTFINLIKNQTKIATSKAKLVDLTSDLSQLQ